MPKKSNGEKSKKPKLQVVKPTVEKLEVAPKRPTVRITPSKPLPIIIKPAELLTIEPVKITLPKAAPLPPIEKSKGALLDMIAYLILAFCLGIVLGALIAYQTIIPQS